MKSAVKEKPYVQDNFPQENAETKRARIAKAADAAANPNTPDFEAFIAKYNIKSNFA